MSRLILVRHGQASFLEANYDRLSPLGETQSRLLGEYWVRNKLIFDRVYSGPRVRQKETARIVSDVYRAAGLPWPELSEIAEFDEFQAEAVLERSLPRLIQEEEHLRKLNDQFQAAATRPEKFKAFQRMFEIVIARWAHGELPVPGIEAWPEFCHRVARGLERLSGNGTRGQCIAVFSSGGPIGVAMQRALHLPTESTLRSAWMVINSACTEFLFSGDRFTLGSYNSYPHLTDPGLITFR